MKDHHALATIVLAAAASAAIAAPGDGDKSAKVYEQAANTSIFTFDYGPPASPALSLMGLSPDKITLSTTLKPFALSLPSLFDGSGNQTAGIDFAPMSLFYQPAKEHFRNYRKDYAYRLLARTRIEIAGTNGFKSSDASKTKPSMVAFGLSTSLFDGSDPLMAQLADRLPGPGDYFNQCLTVNDETFAVYDRIFSAQTANGEDQAVHSLNARWATVRDHPETLTRLGSGPIKLLAPDMFG